MKREGDDFVVLWGPLRIGIVLNGVREDKDGRLAAEITVMSIRADGTRTGTIEWGTLNLSSLSAREGLERVLRRRAEAEPQIDWDKALRWVCANCALAYREPRPVVDLRTVPVIRGGQRFLFDRIWPYGEVGTLYGDGSSGKSMTAMLVAVSYALGERVGGVFLPSETGVPLYLDWEATEDEHAKRLDALSRGLGLREPPYVAYRFMQRTLADDAARVRKDIDEAGAGLVIVDSMGLACGNVVDQEAVMRFYAALRSFPQTVTKIVVTHVSADGARQERGAAAPVGLRWVNNYGRSNWELRADRDDRAGSLDVAMYHRKANGFALQHPLGVRYVFDPIDGAVGVERFDVLSNAVLTAHGSANDQILGFLRETPAEAPDIATGTGLKQNVCRARLSGLLKSGAVVRIGHVWHVNGAAS
jgi:hypothetical protein